MREKAESYRYLISEIDLIDDEIKELNTKFPDPAPALKVELDELLSLLEKRKGKCLKESKDFEDWIVSIPDPRIKEAMFLRYVDGLTWDEVGREQLTPGCTVKMRCYRYFNKH